ncbi:MULTISPECIES: hypothetical protein [unclassified Streptomyces]|uniref:hypothetical protein n=1 Tax=unclassified Streptomyces TaxID=2593676 RepID=UPI001F04F871|nr:MULTISPECIES: hypothetical protein [unclassified Streptomyces]MCH0566380.1 hypothetical protein [Streptomyces sp. MUM 2J]MCH0571586.1 hypothetical protein [Streptomyces sp. MUM 136J]
MKRFGIGLGFLASTTLGAVIGMTVDFFGPRTIEKVIAPQPVSFSAARDEGDEGWVLALPKSANMENLPGRESGCSGVYDWAKKQDAADVRQSILMLAAQGQRGREIAITNMRAKIIRKYTPPKGTEITCPTSGGETVIGIGLELDSPNPVAHSVDESGNFGDKYFSSNYVTLAEHEISTFRVTARAQKYAYEWELEVEVLEDGKRGTVTLRDGDRPFRTAPASETYEAYYEWALFSPTPSLATSTPFS